MSLVSTWAKAVDGQFYKNPVFRGEDYFLCFDDKEPPEIVIKACEKPLARMEAVLKELGISYSKLGGLGYCGRCFNIDAFTINNAYAAFMVISAPIPIPHEYEEVRDKPKGECVYYDFGT